MSFITKNDILYSEQYGFRKNFSTSFAILNLLEEITSKLELYGVRGISLNWLGSYLLDMKQYVTINDHESV